MAWSKNDLSPTQLGTTVLPSSSTGGIDPCPGIVTVAESAFTLFPAIDR